MIDAVLNVFMVMISLHHILLNEEIIIRLVLFGGEGCFVFSQRHRARMWQNKVPEFEVIGSFLCICGHLLSLIHC